jgi:hypothetical protein
MIERLPQFAELHVAALCASSGVVCNKADQDECGWDLFLQFPAKRTPGRPADMEPAGPEALVQVKSTRSEPLTARMKLSNALRLTQANQPCFVVLVVAEQEMPRVYARHFWEPEIARTLKRIRLAERDGDTSFNRRHIGLRMTEADRQEDLIAWMRRTIEAVKPNYATEKAQIASSVGHEDGFGSMKVTFEGSAQDLLDLQLGLVDSLPVLRGRYVPQRFGIEAATPEIEFEEAKLLVEAVPKPARLRLQGGSPTEEMLVDAQCYSAELPGPDDTLHRWRVDAGPLRIVGGNGSYAAKLSMRYDARRQLADLKMFLTMADWRGTGPVGLQLFIEDKRVPLGVLTIDPNDDDNEWKELRVWTKALEAVARTALTPEPQVSVLDLCDAEPWIQRFAGFVMSPSIRVDYAPEGIDDPTRAAVYYAACDVGEWCFLAVVERNTRTDEMDGAKRKLTFGAPQLLDAFVRAGKWRDHRDEIDAAYRAQVARLGTPETLWEMGEIEAFIAKVSRPKA